MTEREIFSQALEIEAAGERFAFLDRACAGDAALRERVNELLAEQQNLGSYLEVPAAAVATTERTVTMRAGQRIGRYKLMEQIGEGGMGTVWVAEQTEPVKRRVALKLIKAGMDTRQVLARFDAERQALALMDHPNIAKVYDGGMTDEGRPFFVMEYVKGVPITHYCDSMRLSIADRLKLFVPVCQAVQHAHQKGVIHRDVKPSNILVCLYDGLPVPKVIDFGLAKAISQPLTEHTLYTAHGLMVGTPLYMSPEQAEFNNFDIDTRTDIYSLGVILYELLTGTTPLERKQIKEAAFQEILRLIKEVEPPKPSRKLGSSASLPSIAALRSLGPAQLNRLVRGDLDWIVMKALEKERSRRYETANGLARDIERFIYDEPVDARPPSSTYRLKKLARKHRGLLASVTSMAALLVVGTTVSAWQARTAMLAQTAERVAKNAALEAAAREQIARRSAEAAGNAEKLAKESAQAREREVNAVLNFVRNRILAAARPAGQAGGLGHDVTLRQALEAALPFVDQNFTNQPLIEARLRITIGDSFWYLGNAKIAAEQYEAAHSLYLKCLGPYHPDTLHSVHSLANSYAELGRHAEALLLRKETLALRKAKLGLEHRDTLMSMNNLASSYRTFGRYTDAIRLLEEALVLQRATLGPDSPDALLNMSNLARNYAHVGRHPEALALFEETLAIRKAKLGDDHPDTLRSMRELAAAYRTAGKGEDALTLHKETLALQRAKLGSDHPDTLRSLWSVGATLLSLHRATEALPFIDECLNHCRGKSLDPSIPFDTVVLRLRHFERTGDGAGCRATAEIWEQLARVDAVSLYNAARMRGVTAHVLRTADPPDVQEAEDNVDRGMEWLRKAVAAGFSDVAELAEDKDLDALRGREEFQELLQTAVRAIELKVRATPHLPSTLASMKTLASTYAAIGRNKDALKLREEIMSIQKIELGPKNAETLQSMNDVAYSYAALGRHAEALKLREETLAVRKAILGPDHPRTLINMRGVVECLVKLDRTAEAIPIIDECVKLSVGKVVDPRIIPAVIEHRLRHFAKAQDAAGCRQTAEMWENLKRTDATSFHEAAKVRAVTAAVIHAAKSSDGAANGFKAEADRAMEWLQKAVAAGYANAAQLASDKDFDVLRGRQDFQRLWSAVESGRGTKHK